MKLEIHEDLSFTTNLFNTFIMPLWRLTRRRPVSPKGSQALKPAFMSDCDWTERKVDGIFVYDITLKGMTSKPTKRVLYFPGGAFVSPASPFHIRIAARICRQHPGTQVTFVAYPLAPLNPAPETYPTLVKLYHSIAKEATDSNQEFIISGDSAGGNLALSLPLHILSTSPESLAPTKIVAIVPVCTTDTSILSEVAPNDPALSPALFDMVREQWGGEWGGDDPRVSPLYADLSVLQKRDVQVFILSAGSDCCAPGAMLFLDKADKAGVQGVFCYWPHMQHLSFALWGLGLKDFSKYADWFFKQY